MYYNDVSVALSLKMGHSLGRMWQLQKKEFITEFTCTLLDFGPETSELCFMSYDTFLIDRTVMLYPQML